jgi:hypothetical protein
MLRRHFTRRWGVTPRACRRRFSQLASVRASVIGMLSGLEADPGFVEAEEPANLIRMAATGRADDLADEACSIYDPVMHARVSATAKPRLISGL